MKESLSTVYEMDNMSKENSEAHSFVLRLVSITISLVVPGSLPFMSFIVY